MNPKSTDQRHPRVVVIGGGYAGVLAANRLQRRADVTLINPRAAFVERIRLHQLVTGSSTATQDYADVLGTAVRLVVDAARHIDAASRTVHLDSGAALDYDYLIYAVGSTGAIPEGAPGASEFAYPLAELEQAQRLHARLADVPPGAPANPMSDADADQKYRSCAGVVLDEPTIERTRAMILGIDRLADVGALCSALEGGTRP